MPADNVTRVLVVAGRSVDVEELGRELEHDEEVEIKLTEPGGEGDPLLAIEDALTGFEADQIVLVPQAPDRQTWAEQGLLEEARERFPVPVREIEA